MVDQSGDITQIAKVIPRKPGNYQFRSAINGQPQIIPRFSHPDESGLLYIGKGKRLRSRITKFFRCVNGETKAGKKHYPSGAVSFLESSVQSENKLKISSIDIVNYLSKRKSFRNKISPKLRGNIS